MSRDFTPQMHYMISREYPLIYQSQITYTFSGQEPAPMFTEEQLELMKKYNTLYPITIDFFFELRDRMSERDFERLNDTFKELVITPQREWDKFPEELVKYFKGELDPLFYYHEDNDRLFKEWVLNKFCEDPVKDKKTCSHRKENKSIERD